MTKGQGQVWPNVFLAGVFWVGLLEGCAAFTAPPPVEVQSAVSDQDPIPTAVSDIEDKASVLSATEQSQLSELFRSALGRQETFRVIPQDVIRTELQARKLDSYAAGQDEASQIEVGKAVSARQLIRPRLFRAKERCTWSAAVYDVETETQGRTESIEASCTAQGADEVLTRLARTLGRPEGTADVAGRWILKVSGDQHEDLVFIVQSGKTVATFDGGNGRYEGQVKGRVFEGNWYHNGFSGRLRLEFSNDGKSFAGTWGLGQADLTNTSAGSRAE